jgi:hypothetical protein
LQGISGTPSAFIGKSTSLKETLISNISFGIDNMKNNIEAIELKTMFVGLHNLVATSNMVEQKKNINKSRCGRGKVYEGSENTFSLSILSIPS